MNEDLQPVISFAEFDLMETELYHKNYSNEYMDKCNELGLKNIESYACRHSYGCDCPVGEADPAYFCVWCGDMKRKSELKGDTGW